MVNAVREAQTRDECDLLDGYPGCSCEGIPERHLDDEELYTFLEVFTCVHCKEPKFRLTDECHCRYRDLRIKHGESTDVCRYCCPEWWE